MSDITTPCRVCRLLTPEQRANLGTRPGEKLSRAEAADAASTWTGKAVSEHYIRKHWEHLLHEEQLSTRTLFDAPGSTAPAAKPAPRIDTLVAAPKGFEAGVTLDAHGGEISTGVVTEPVLHTDWSFVFERFNLDPNEFEIADDTVRMSSWPLATVDAETGEVVEHPLFAYKARFRRRAASLLPLEDIAALFARVRDWPTVEHETVPAAVDAETLENPATFVVNWADWQIGKGEGGGVAATVERVRKSIAATVARFHELVAAGRNIEQIVIANLGDPVEGVSGNYANQTYTVELNQRDQLNLVLDLWVAGLRELLPLAPRAKFVSVLCNHGQWTRNGGKAAITDDADNAGAFLADTVRRVLEHQPGFEHVEWVIARDEMILTVEMSGVLVALSHGHTAKGDIIKWAELQMVRQRQLFGAVDFWIVAHRHHFLAGDWWAQCPALDGGSKWLTDMNGSNSPTGTLTFLIGTGRGERVWSDMAVL